MNKNILTAAIGAAMIVGPLAAQADLKIGGRVAGSLISVDGTIAFSDFGNTRIQFDASDDSGWFARAAIDQRLGRLQSEIGSVGSFRTNRDQYVGLKTGMGSFMFGRLAGAVKNLEGDPYIATFLELRNGAVKGGSLGSSSFRNSMLGFTNKFGDTSVNLQLNPTTGSGEYNLGVKAKLAGASVFLGYHNQGGGTTTFYKLGGSMKFGDIKANLYYQDDAGTTRFVLGADMGLGDGASVNFSYGDKGQVATFATYRLAYMKKVSKKARYWIGYSQNGSDTGTGTNTVDRATYGAGARVDF